MFCLSLSAACNALEQQYAKQNDYYTSEFCTIISTCTLATYAYATDLLLPEEAALLAAGWSTARIITANTDCKELERLIRKAHIAAGSLLAFASPGPFALKPCVAALYWVGSEAVPEKRKGISQKQIDNWRKNHQG